VYDGIEVYIKSLFKGYVRVKVTMLKKLFGCLKHLHGERFNFYSVLRFSDGFYFSLLL